MSSIASRAANRRNARKSTGPRTTAGKCRASRNALRHGLAARTFQDPAVGIEAEQLARALAGQHAGAFRLEQMRIIAEMELQLTRVRNARAMLMKDLAHAHHTLDAQKPAAEINQFKGADQNPVSPVSRLSDLLSRVRALERYERRAFSRRNRAIRDLGRRAEQRSA
jgi:hypothetical protein